MPSYLRIPKERVGVLIGPSGKVRKQLEESTGVRLEIDSEEGEVTVDTTGAEDPALGLAAADVVQAIGRGFSPERALRLLQEGMRLEVFDIRDFVGKSQEQVRRMRARLIGTKGKTRRIFEELTGVSMSIYGNTVALIGDLLPLDVARRGVEMLLQGSEHAAVYGYLEHRRAELRIAEMGF